MWANYKRRIPFVHSKCILSFVGQGNDFSNLYILVPQISPWGMLLTMLQVLVQFPFNSCYFNMDNKQHVIHILTFSLDSLPHISWSQNKGLDALESMLGLPIDPSSCNFYFPIQHKNVSVFNTSLHFGINKIWYSARWFGNSITC